MSKPSQADFSGVHALLSSFQTRTLSFDHFQETRHVCFPF